VYCVYAALVAAVVAAVVAALAAAALALAAAAIALAAAAIAVVAAAVVTSDPAAHGLLGRVQQALVGTWRTLCQEQVLPGWRGRCRGSQLRVRHRLHGLRGALQVAAALAAVLAAALAAALGAALAAAQPAVRRHSWLAERPRLVMP